MGTQENKNTWNHTFLNNTWTLADLESDASGRTFKGSPCACAMAIGLEDTTGCAGGGVGTRFGGGAVDRSYKGGLPRFRLTIIGWASSCLRLLDIVVICPSICFSDPLVDLWKNMNLSFTESKKIIELYYINGKLL